MQHTGNAAVFTAGCLAAGLVAVMSSDLGKQFRPLHKKRKQQQQQLALLGPVCCRWAQVDAGGAQPEADSEIHPMVLNIGRRPTVEADAAAAVTVEVHVMHSFAASFYGRHCRALVSGYIRWGLCPGCLERQTGLSRCPA